MALPACMCCLSTSAAHAAQVKGVRNSTTHHRPCRLLAFASTPPLLVLLALLAHAWHGAPSPRHARFVAFDGGRCHRTPPRGAPYTGQPVIVVIKQTRWERHGTHIDGGRDHAVVLFSATGQGGVGLLLYKNKDLHCQKTFVQ